jgi:YbgC/YbaW family acyl-CoA thioester hydrolase
LARVKLAEKENYRFSHEQRVYIANLNAAGHVGAPQMIELIHDGRYQLMKKLGFSEINLGDGKTGSILSDLVVNYKAELFLDDLVVIETDIAEIEEKGFRVFHRIVKNGKTAVIAETGHVCFNYQDKSIGKVPDIFKQKLSEI